MEPLSGVLGNLSESVTPSLKNSIVNETVRGNLTNGNLPNVKSTALKDCSSSDTVFNQSGNVKHRLKRNIVKPIKFKDFV